MTQASITEKLETTARTLVAPGKGILAMDESTGTCSKRFEAHGVDGTEENRRAYRELLLTTPGLAESVSGAILYDETIRQTTAGGIPFPKIMDAAGILIGIKVDIGAKPLAGHPGETVTEGLDGLRDRLEEYVSLNAVFAKWRAVLTIEDPSKPSRGAVVSNAHALARYAALCQEQGLVPIVEPEVLFSGDHSIATCEAVTTRVLRETFYALADQQVYLPGVILKPSMVLAGDRHAEQPDVDEVARRTLAVLSECVPEAVAGITFLSGGQSDERATVHLRRINQLATDAPWRLTFSFGRALQRKALSSWANDPADVETAQGALIGAVTANSRASLSES